MEEPQRWAEEETREEAMEIVYRPYVDPQLESLIERLHPPRVCVDNDSFEDCTLVKVDSANKHGILLEMVQDLTDLDLVISKSYISSDGGWFMDVFHVTDQLGHKLTDQSLIFYIQEILCARRREGFTAETRSCIRRQLKPIVLGSEQTALEMTGTDRPGLISEILAVLVELGCNVTAAVAWTHNGRVASIIYLEEGFGGGPIRDPKRLAYVEEQLENVLEAHHGEDEKKRLRLIAPAAGRTHTERRLHQLMCDDGDYERCGGCGRTQVEIESCKERGYSIVNITCRDRPKLLFDTVCALTDMHYVVFHAAVSSSFSIANQEYFVRHKDGCAMDTESERKKLKLCLIAAIERRVSRGLRLDLCTQKRMGLLSDITRVFRENGLSISRIEIGINGEKAVGSFHVTDASGNEVNLCAAEAVIEEIGGTAIAVHKPSKWVANPPPLPPLKRKQSSDIACVEEKPRLSSLASLLWSQLERFSHTVLGH